MKKISITFVSLLLAFNASILKAQDPKKPAEQSMNKERKVERKEEKKGAKNEAKMGVDKKEKKSDYRKDNVKKKVDE